MEQILCFTDYIKGVFKVRGWWYIIPFALVGVVLTGVFYIYSAVYMLLDLIRFELKKVLYKNNEQLSGGAQFVKFLVGFIYYIVFALVAIFAILPLAIFFFLAYCCFFVSSIGKVRGNPFAFHKIEESK